MCHRDAGDLPAYTEVLDRLPCPFVIDHMARVDAGAGLEEEPFRALLRLLADERCWGHGVQRRAADGGRGSAVRRGRALARALIAADPYRVLWGTDWPHPNVRPLPDDGDLVDLLPPSPPGRPPATVSSSTTRRGSTTSPDALQQTLPAAWAGRDARLVGVEHRPVLEPELGARHLAHRYQVGVEIATARVVLRVGGAAAAAVDGLLGERAQRRHGGHACQPVGRRPVLDPVDQGGKTVGRDGGVRGTRYEG